MNDDEWLIYHEEALLFPAYANAWRKLGMRKVEIARELRVQRIMRRLDRKALRTMRYGHTQK